MATTFKFGGGNWAVKDGYALAYNDENNNFKPLPFDFTRASTATRVNKQGLVETVPSGKPRIDFTDNTSGHLLIEPSRTNVNTYSEALNNWTIYPGVTLTSGQDSPDGGTNAYKIELISGVNAYVYKGGGTTGVQYTISGYFRADSNVTIGFNDGGFNGNSIDLTTEWKRYTFTYTKGSTGGIQLDNYFGVSPAQEAKTFYAWGLQMEAGSYATSYIPTEGSSVTRVAERNSQGNLSNVLSSSGVLYTEIELGKSTTNTSSSNLRFSLSNNGSTNDWVFFGIEGGDNLRTYVRASGSTSTDAVTNGVFPSSGIYKVAFRFDLNNTKVFVNGVQKYSDVSSTPPSNLNFFQQGGTGVGASDISETLKVIETRLYNTALTDTELQNLTS